MNGPLSEVLVLDLSRVLAGPYCTMILGDMGADVIKIEHPSGDETRTWGPPFVQGESAYYLAFNRNKRSAIVDLKTEAGSALVRRIAQRADILVENFLPGAFERFGLSLQQLRAENPRLITLTISGLGATGPDRDVPGYDFILQAGAGLMSITGPVEGPPSRFGVAVTDLTTGLMATNAVLAALYARERTGRGQHIDISLLESAVAWLANVGTAFLVTGNAPARYGNAHPNIVPYQTFSTADRDIAIAVGNDAQFQRFCATMELAELAADARYQTNAGRVEHRKDLIASIVAALKERKSADVFEKLRAAAVPVGLVRTIPEVMSDPQVIAREMIEKVPHPTIGEVRLLGIPFKFSDTPASVRRHPPLLGEHTEEVVAEYAS